MIESIEFREGVFTLSIARTPVPSATAKSKRSFELNFRQCATISVLHRREIMNFLEAVYPEGAEHIGDLIFKLLCAHARVRWVNLYCIDGPGESL